MTYKRSYWRDFYVTLHVQRAACFYFIVVIGAFLSPVVHYDRLALSLLASFFFLQLSAYALDELKGRHCGTQIPDDHYKIRAIIGLVGAFLIAVYLGFTLNIYIFILAIIGAVVVVGYNFEVLGLHSRLIFMFSWAFYPLITNYYLQSLSIPTIPVIMFGIAVSVFAYLHIISYGNFSCRLETCVDMPRHDCHGQSCFTRRTLPRGVHKLQKQIAYLEVVFLFVITLSVIALHFG